MHGDNTLLHIFHWFNSDDRHSDSGPDTGRWQSLVQSRFNACVYVCRKYWSAFKCNIFPWCLALAASIGQGSLKRPPRLSCAFFFTGGALSINLSCERLLSRRYEGCLSKPSRVQRRGRAFLTVGQMSLVLNYSDAQGLLVGWVATPITQHSVAPEALLGCVLGELLRVLG